MILITCGVFYRVLFFFFFGECLYCPRIMQITEGNKPCDCNRKKTRETHREGERYRETDGLS